MKKNEFRTGNGMKIPYGKIGVLCIDVPFDPWDERITDKEVYTLMEKVIQFTKGVYPEDETTLEQVPDIIDCLMSGIMAVNKSFAEKLEGLGK